MFVTQMHFHLLNRMERRHVFMTFAVGAKVLMVQNVRHVRSKIVKSVNLIHLKFVHTAMQVMF